MKKCPKGSKGPKGEPGVLHKFPIRNGTALGYDPGTLGGGYCFIDIDDEVVVHKSLKFKSGMDVRDVAKEVSKEMGHLISRLLPDVIVVERPFFKFSHLTQFKLDFMVGWICGIAYDKGTFPVVVPVTHARKVTGDPKPESKSAEKDLYDSKTFAKYGRILIQQNNDA